MPRYQRKYLKFPYQSGKWATGGSKKAVMTTETVTSPERTLKVRLIEKAHSVIWIHCLGSRRACKLGFTLKLQIVASFLHFDGRGGHVISTRLYSLYMILGNVIGMTLFYFIFGFMK